NPRVWRQAALVRIRVGCLRKRYLDRCPSDGRPPDTGLLAPEIKASAPLDQAVGGLFRRRLFSTRSSRRSSSVFLGDGVAFNSVQWRTKASTDLWAARDLSSCSFALWSPFLAFSHARLR